MYNAKYVNYEDIDSVFIEHWKRLEERSLEDNAYLSSAFVLPAIKYLSERSRTYIVGVYNSDESRLCGLGVFTYSRGTIDFPLPHFIAFKSTHSYLTGVVLDNTDSIEVLTEMFSFIGRSKPRIYGIKFTDFCLTGQIGDIFRDIERLEQFSWYESAVKNRACLELSNMDESLIQNISAKRRKKHRHALNKLRKIDTVSWRLVMGNKVTRCHVDKFIDLEDKGWRGETGTSLSSQESHKRFFIEIIEQFTNAGNVFFTELILGDRVIASTCNFIAGKTGFAFKIGWDTDYKDYSPGVLNEMEFLRESNNNAVPVIHMDSGAGEDSFINHYWPTRKVLTRGVLSLNPMAAAVCQLAKTVRRWKHSIGKPMR